MPELGPRELSREEITRLGERVAYLESAYGAQANGLLNLGKSIEALHLRGASVFAEGARKALLVANGVMSADELLAEIDSLAMR